ncbi:hypothetical protein LINGRAHAP2_LOCUS25150, partial [Linum grandiflorum]
TSILLRLPVFLSCWIGTRWSKFGIYIGKATGWLTIWLVMVIVYLLVFIVFLLVDSTLSIHILYDLFEISKSRLIVNKK